MFHPPVNTRTGGVFYFEEKFLRLYEGFHYRPEYRTAAAGTATLGNRGKAYLF